METSVCIIDSLLINNLPLQRYEGVFLSHGRVIHRIDLISTMDLEIAPFDANNDPIISLPSSLVPDADATLLMLRMKPFFLRDPAQFCRCSTRSFGCCLTLIGQTLSWSSSKGARGRGKNQFIRMIGVLDRGVCLIFIPLLTLSTKVMAKFQSACYHYGSVRAYHLDDVYDANTELFADDLHACTDIESNSNSTIFLFASPQYLCYSTPALNTFLLLLVSPTTRNILLTRHEICGVGSAILFLPLLRQQQRGFAKKTKQQRKEKEEESLRPRILMAGANEMMTYTQINNQPSMPCSYLREVNMQQLFGKSSNSIDLYIIYQRQNRTSV